MKANIPVFCKATVTLLTLLSVRRIYAKPFHSNAPAFKESRNLLQRANGTTKAITENDDVFCYKHKMKEAFPVTADACASSIDFIITRDGIDMYNKRQPFYYGRKHYPNIHQTPDTWVGIFREPNPCQVKLTVFEPKDIETVDRGLSEDSLEAAFEAKDVFTLANVASVANKILVKCIKEGGEKYSLGGEGYVGNRRGFFVILNGVPSKEGLESDISLTF